MNERFSRTTITHPKCFDLNSGNTSVSSSIGSIEQCLRLLLTTSKGELLGDPFFGTNIMAFINEPNDIVLKDEIVDDFVNAIKSYEKRITVGQDDITIVQIDKKVNISITYYVNELGKVGNFELSMLRGDYNGDQQLRQ